MKKGHVPDYNFDIIKQRIKEGATLAQLAKEWNVRSSSLSRVLRKAEIEYNLQVRKISKNEDFFESIDSEIKAYLLGFLVADGCIYNKNRFGVCIGERDIEIINLFSKYIAPDSKIRKKHNLKGAKDRKPQILLRISSEKLVSDLKKYGVVERKTYQPINIPDISLDLKWHFIRGYFDGDGHLGIRTQKTLDGKGAKSCRIQFANGDKKILEDIQTLFGEKSRLKEQKRWWTLEIEGSRRVGRFLDLMYKNANFYLKRKFDTYVLVNTEVIPALKRAETP